MWRVFHPRYGLHYAGEDEGRARAWAARIGPTAVVKRTGGPAAGAAAVEQPHAADALAALRACGFAAADAARMVGAVAGPCATVQELITEALKHKRA